MCSKSVYRLTQMISTDGQALTVLDYCLHAGSENVVIYFKDNIYVVK